MARAIPFKVLTHPQWGQVSGRSVKRLAKYVTTFGALTLSFFLILFSINPTASERYVLIDM